MKIETIITKQGHPVPSQVMPPRGPFPPELMAQPKVIYDYPRQGEDGNLANSVEGTAQNGFQPTKWYRCNECDALVPGNELDVHACE